jgi:hypothetical protein
MPNIIETPVGSLGWRANKKEKKNLKEYHASALPGITGLGALGLLGAGATRLMGTDKVMDTAQSTIDAYDPEAFVNPDKLPAGLTDMAYYATTTAPWTAMSLGGLPVGEVVARARASETMLKLLGQDGKDILHAGDDLNGPRGLGHYAAFAKGPISGWAHKLRRNNTANMPESYGANIPYADWITDKMKKVIEEDTGHVMDPAEANLRFLDNARQTELLKRLHFTLTPEEQALRMKMEDMTPEHSSDNVASYMGAAKKYLQARNIAKRVAATGLGAATGGTIAHLLHDSLRKKQHGRNVRDWKYWLAAAAGTGAGGVLGYNYDKLNNLMG